MNGTVFLCFALSTIVVLVAGDCISYDAKVDAALFKPLRDQLHSTNSEYYSLANFNAGIAGFGASWTGADVGNFSSLILTAGEGSASQLCTDGNTKTFTVNLGFQDLEMDFGVLNILTPFFTITGSRASLKLSGESLDISVSTTTNPDANTCTAALGEFKFTQWGSLELNLGSGLFNWGLELIFNNFANRMVLGLLQTFGVGDQINNFSKSTLSSIVQSQSAVVCSLIETL